MTDAETDAFLLRITPEEFRDLAGIFDLSAQELQSIDPPQVAIDFHNTQIEGFELVAEMLRDAAGDGLTQVYLANINQIDAGDDLKIAHGQASLTVCPAFQQVLDYYAGDDDGTSEAE